MNQKSTLHRTNILCKPEKNINNQIIQQYHIRNAPLIEQTCYVKQRLQHALESLAGQRPRAFVGYLQNGSHHSVRSRSVRVPQKSKIKQLYLVLTHSPPKSFHSEINGGILYTRIYTRFIPVPGQLYVLPFG
jgi:hypothetical protein